MNWKPWRRNEDLDDELAAHFRMDVQDRIARGEHPRDAERNARREFGNELLVRETTRDMWAWAAWDRLAQDLKYALRRIQSNRGFTLIAILTLALGIGVNTAIFTLVHAVMFNRLPVSRPTELYRLGRGDNCCVMSGYQNGQDFALFSYELYKTLRDGTPEIQHLAAFQAAPSTVAVRRGASSEPGNSFKLEFVSSNYFDLFGLRPALGGFFGASDEIRGASTLVLSYRAWQNYFGGDRGAVGSSVLIKDKPFTVIGVAPSAFYGETLRADPPDCWVPAASLPLLDGVNNVFDRPGTHWLYLMGRIPSGVSAAGLQSKIDAEAKRWFYEQAGTSPTVKVRRAIENQFVPLDPASGGVETMSIAYRNGLVLLMSLSSLVLLIACANVANLLLARGTAMRAQNALKVALGASRARMIRQALLDSLLLALAGAAAGLALAFVAARLIVLLAFRGARYVPISTAPSGTVLIFAIAVSAATGLLFGIVPAWIETHSDPVEALRGASRSTHATAILPQRILVIAQATLSLVLLTGAGLLTESLWNLERQHFGFRTAQRVIVKLNPALEDYTPERLTAVYRVLQQRLAELPGVTGVGLATYLPMTAGNRNGHIFIEGSPNEYEPGAVSWVRVGPGYFDAIGTRLLQGRAIDESDRAGSPRTAVVNQTFVDRYCKGRNPLGMRFGTDGGDRSIYYLIAGVVEDTKYNDTYRPAYATYFVSLLQPELNAKGTLSGDNFIGGIALHVNSTDDNLEPLLRRTIARVDSNLGVTGVIAYADQLALSFTRERLLAVLTQLFGALALALASIGLYGMVALSAGRRTAEIGVRMALGASRSGVIAMILRGALVQVVLGIVIGVPVSAAAARLIEHQLFGVPVFHPPTMAGATVLLIACAVAAAMVPAWRAARVDPMLALRVE